MSCWKQFPGNKSKSLLVFSSNLPVSKFPVILKNRFVWPHFWRSKKPLKKTRTFDQKKVFFTSFKKNGVCSQKHFFWRGGGKRTKATFLQILEQPKGEKWIIRKTTFFSHLRRWKMPKKWEPFYEITLCSTNTYVFMSSHQFGFVPAYCTKEFGFCNSGSFIFAYQFTKVSLASNHNVKIFSNPTYCSNNFTEEQEKRRGIFDTVIGQYVVVLCIEDAKIEVEIYVKFSTYAAHTSITKISVPLNVINLVKKIFSCGAIHKGNFLTCTKVTCYM